MIFVNFEQISGWISRRDLHHSMQDNASDGEIMEAENVGLLGVLRKQK